MSRADSVAEELKAMLALISKDNGFATDAGAAGYRGKAVGLEEIAAPCITLYEDEATVLSQKGRQVVVRAPYVAEASGPCDADNPNAMGQALAADICSALWPETPNATLEDLLMDDTGLAYAGHQILPRPPGQASVTVQVKFNATFVFNLSQP